MSGTNPAGILKNSSIRTSSQPGTPGTCGSLRTMATGSQDNVEFDPSSPEQSAALFAQLRERARSLKPETPSDSSEAKHDTLKIVFLGEAGVGQNGFLASLMTESTTPGASKPLEITTRVVDNYVVDDNTVKLEIVELGSSNADYEERRDTLIMEAAAVVLVYSVADQSTLEVLAAMYKPLVERLKSRHAAVGVVGLLEGRDEEQEVEKAIERLETFRLCWEYDDVIHGLSRDQLFQSRSNTGQFMAELVRLVVELRAISDSTGDLVAQKRKCLWF